MISFVHNKLRSVNHCDLSNCWNCAESSNQLFDLGHLISKFYLLNTVSSNEKKQLLCTVIICIYEIIVASRYLFICDKHNNKREIRVLRYLAMKIVEDAYKGSCIKSYIGI